MLAVAHDQAAHAVLVGAHEGETQGDRVGGDGDATPAALGVTSCPARTIPGGSACANPAVTDLAGVVACVECLATFESTCGTQLVATPGTVAESCTAP